MHRPAIRLAFVLALAAVRAGAGAGDLPELEAGSETVVVMPDTERYSDDYPEMFAAQTRWIAAAAERRRIAYALHLGDVTQHNAPAEWEVARRCFAMLDGRVPYALVPGNHDYEGNAPARESSRLSEYFPADAMRERGGMAGVFEEGKLDNSFSLTRLAGREWLVLCLEMGPRDEVVAWANKVLAKHRDRRAIIVTHAYLFRDNQRYDHTKGKQRASPHTWGNDGEQLWQKLVRRHPNAMIVLSGHVSTGGLGYLASAGDAGNVVHQMMVDYEKEKRGGQAFLRLLEFAADGKTVRVRTYSPALGETRESPLEAFSFELVEAKPAAEAQPPTTQRSR